MGIDAGGKLNIITPLGSITENAPFSFQSDGREVVSRYLLNGNILGFEVENHQANEMLTIDPGVEWATYYGGNGVKDFGSSIATDKEGNVFLAGTTFDNPDIAPGGHQSAAGGNADAFLVKFNAQGQRLWATYYGGGWFEPGYFFVYDKFWNVFFKLG